MSMGEIAMRILADIISVLRINALHFLSPYPDSRLIDTQPASGDSRVGRFGVTLAATQFDPSGPPDEVTFIGFNLHGGGGALEDGKTGVGLSIEDHYQEAEGRSFAEIHVIYVDATGVQRRPLSYRIRKEDGVTDELHTVTQALFFMPDDNRQYAAISENGLWLNPVGADGPVVLQGSDRNVYLQHLGSNVPLNVTEGWSVVQLPTRVQLGVGRGELFEQDGKLYWRSFVNNTLTYLGG